MNLLHYRNCYRKLFLLIMSDQAFSDEARGLRDQMDKLWPILERHWTTKDREYAHQIYAYGYQLYNQAIKG